MKNKKQKKEKVNIIFTITSPVIPLGYFQIALYFIGQFLEPAESRIQSHCLGFELGSMLEKLLK